jgi:hypothetical protein
MDALAGEGVEVGGQHRHQGFAFPGFHFGDFALMEDDAADELDVKGPEPQDPQGRLPDRGKGLGQQVVQGLALVQTLSESRCPGGEFGVGGLAQLRFKRGDGIHQGRQAFKFPVVFTAKDFFQE